MPPPFSWWAKRTYMQLQPNQDPRCSITHIQLNLDHAHLNHGLLPVSSPARVPPKRKRQHVHTGNYYPHRCASLAAIIPCMGITHACLHADPHTGTHTSQAHHTRNQPAIPEDQKPGSSLILQIWRACSLLPDAGKTGTRCDLSVGWGEIRRSRFWRRREGQEAAIAGVMWFKDNFPSLISVDISEAIIWIGPVWLESSCLARRIDVAMGGCSKITNFTLFGILHYWKGTHSTHTHVFTLHLWIYSVFFFSLEQCTAWYSVS